MPEQQDNSKMNRKCLPVSRGKGRFTGFMEVEIDYLKVLKNLIP